VSRARRRESEQRSTKTGRSGGSEKSRVQGGVAGSLLALLRLFGQENSLDVWQHAALGDGDARQQLVQLLVVPDGQLQMAGDDAALLVVASGVACQLEHLGGQVLHDGGQVDGCAGTNALAVVALPQQTMDPADGEL